MYNLIEKTAQNQLIEFTISFLKNNTKIINSVKYFPTVTNILDNANSILKNNGLLYITTPNNAYFQGNKMSYNELKYVLENIFSSYTLWFYNTFRKLSKTNRKLNFAENAKI